ncbi:hypothetical protein TRFO_05471 [Tritrichomonas foetus]|uniref:FH2 domain-containing protein n=1 Tax=Tritrichomonas foetus TaxID=1144522 RepID=A0A1J4K6G7_9EUKA|nr:hypothetical protein TRFO_05471 [Tritrichomonas foetus]|eukprot:OHT06779.1 hypothetical protein TRFO_05471 [Tritrichomonas foetus]
MLVSPDRIEESYIALLPPMELNNRFKRVDDLLNFKQQQQQQQQQPRNAASMHRLPRLFLELAWLIGNKWERKFINIGQILDVMRAARFINQCLPQTQLYEVMRRAASIVQAREGKYLVLEEKTDASKEWKKEANFFGGNDFLVACALQFAQSGFINSKEISMMSCQTLFVVLENCAKLITMNKDKFQQYLREEGDEYVPGDSCIPDSVIDTSASNAPVADSPISVPPPPSGDTPDISGLAPPPPPPPPPDMDGVPSPPGMDGVPPPPPPPPPPPGMDGVPPPPPPPPPPPGMEGVPPPPGCPPPPPKPAGPPKKPNPAPPEKVRAIFWTKIPDVQATKTLWMQIDDSKVKLNTDNLMRIFRAAGTPAKVVRKVADPETQVQKTEEKVTLLSGDSAKSVSIMLNRFKLPPQKIVELVKNLDPSLQEDHIAAIASNMPKPDELAPFKDFSGNISQLTPPDLYFKAIADFPLFQASMEILQLRLSANSEVDEHIATLENVIKACKQVKTSKSFQFILVLILRIGNILNGGGNRGGAYGFKLSTLPKVANARAAMPGETLMSYIVNYIENKHPEMVNLSSDLNMIPAAQKADLRSIRQDLMPLKGRIESVSKAQNDGSDRFKQAAAALVRDVGSNIETALNLLNQAEQEVKNLMTTYYEDQDTSPSDFFDYILTFLNDFDAAREAIAKKKAEEEKAKREASGRPTGRKNAPINIGNQQRGLMDDLFAQIKSGKLKRVE